ncbi:hypothetical protein HA402_009054 [Bradysia odoriphaga]|nr:hypothetical protein HA402_009054 [Bradysia odoriphaga]
MTISIIIVVAIILKIQLTLGQISGTTKCTSSALTSCAYSQIRCPPNYYFNGQYCLPVLAATATPTAQPESTTLPVTKCSSQPIRLPETVPPTNPDPLPVKPVCERYYEWNGRECYQRLANEPICPPGYNLTVDGQCVSVVQALCQENYHLHGDFCVGLLEAPVVCPNDFYWDGAKCLYRIVPSCPEGFILNNGYCEMFDVGACPSGTFMDNFKCIGHHQVKIQCDYGYSWNGESCANSTNSCEDGFILRDNVCEKYIVKQPDFECPPRTQMIGNECVSSEIICPKGFSLIDSMCVEQIASSNETESFITPNCTTGYQLVGCECVQINETTSRPQIPICPPNYVYKDGLCYYEQDHYPPVCPINYVIINGICAPVQPDTTEKPTTDCTEPGCKPNQTSSCACPVGYTLSNGLCILTGQSSKVCPVGYELINDRCIITQSNECPPGHQFVNGSCLQSPCQNVCPPNTQLINGVCVITTDIGSGDCPPGYQKINGKCVPSDNPEVSPCPTGYQWIKGVCVNINPGPENPCFVPCPPGYSWINGACLKVTTVEPIEPGTGNPPLIPVVPPIVRPCYPHDQNSTCPPCPTSNTPCQPCSTTNTPCQPCPTTGTPCQPCSTTNTPCQPCPSNNPPCPTSDQTNPVPPNTGCTNCPQSTHYITKDGHISITNIVNVAHHHQRPPLQHNQIYAPANIDDSFDYDTNGQNATDEEEVAEKCCEVITPRQCKRNGDEWTCYHKKYNRCGEICTQPKIYLKPKMIHYQPPILIMPPPPRRIYGRRRFLSGGAVDCSGCIQGGYRCSVECYSYPDCRRPDCAFIDQDTYCEEWDHNEIEGCSTDDGYFE